VTEQVLDYPTLKELRSALDGRVAPALLFLAGFSDAELGERANVLLRAEREGLEIPVSGIVTWRYPDGLVPPGRTCGVGVLLDPETQEQPLYKSIIDGLDQLVPPGGRLPELLQLSAEGEDGDFTDDTSSISLESDWDSSVGDALADDEGFENERTLSSDELDELDPPSEAREADEDDDQDEIVTLDGAEPDEFSVADTEADFEVPTQDVPPEIAADLSEPPPVRPLPAPEPWPELPLPMLSGRAFAWPPGATVPNQIVTVGWPEEGTQRDTWFERERARGRSVSELISHAQDVNDHTDPAQLPDAVARATADVNEVEDEEETVLALPIALWVGRGDDSPPTVLFEAGAALPAETTVKLRAAKGAVHLEAHVLSERWGEEEQDLVGVLRFPLEEGAPRQARARATLSPTGLLELAIPPDEPKHTEVVETGIVPVPLRASALGKEDRGLLTTLRRLFRND
jgi:hypothetical protein